MNLSSCITLFSFDQTALLFIEPQKYVPVNCLVRKKPDQHLNINNMVVVQGHQSEEQNEVIDLMISRGWPPKQPASIPYTDIRGYLMYFHNSTNWNVVTLRFSDEYNYRTFKNYILGY